MTTLMFAGLFLIGLILLQRGRGGGLAGAFGGMGGQSAFGTKAGDVFTRITIGVAAAWILLCAGSVVALHNASSGLRTDDSLFKKENAVDVEKAKPADEVPPAAENASAAPADKKPDTPAAQTEEKPKLEDKPKPDEPAPATPAENPEPKKDTPAEDKPTETPK